MESLTNLITKPLEAATVVLQTAAAAAAGPAAAPAQPLLQGNATFTDDILRMLLYNLFHGDSRLQAQICQQYYANNVTLSLNEGLLEVHGQGQLQQLLRGVQLFARFKPEVLDIISNADQAIMLVNLNISYKLVPLTWWFPVKAPATVTLTFGTQSDSVITAPADVITHHRQETSLVDLFVWNPAWDWFNKHIWAPYSGQLLAKLAQWEGPVVTNYSSYISSGAGHVQAVLWTIEDHAKLFGLKGLPSAAARLGRQEARRQQQQQQQEQEEAGEEEEDKEGVLRDWHEQQQHQQQQQQQQGEAHEQQGQQQQQHVAQGVTPVDCWRHQEWGSCLGSPAFAEPASSGHAAAAAAAIKGSTRPKSVSVAGGATDQATAAADPVSFRPGSAPATAPFASGSSGSEMSAAAPAPSARLGLTGLTDSASLAARSTPEHPDPPGSPKPDGCNKLSELEAMELAAAVGPTPVDPAAHPATTAAAHDRSSNISSTNAKRLSELETRELAAAAAAGPSTADQVGSSSSRSVTSASDLGEMECEQPSMEEPTAAVPASPAAE